jgi:histidine triad (HIT) family protein
MPRCIFCKIIAKEAPGNIVYQDDRVTAFDDTRPTAPVHILIVPNRHIESVNSITEDDEELMGHLFTVGRRLAEENGIHQSGYRLLVNTGPDSGQAVYHLHLHLMGGQRLFFPIG